MVTAHSSGDQQHGVFGSINIQARGSKYLDSCTGEEIYSGTNQLVRSGTSVGANIREAFYAHGKADFIARLTYCTERMC